jgi:hypothetical protein
LSEWLHNHHRQILLNRELGAGEAFRVWPNLLILGQPVGTPALLPIRPESGWGRWWFSIDEWLGHVQTWIAKSPNVALSAAELARLADLLKLRPLTQPNGVRPAAGQNQDASACVSDQPKDALAALDQRVLRLEQTVRGQAQLLSDTQEGLTKLRGRIDNLGASGAPRIVFSEATGLLAHKKGTIDTVRAQVQLRDFDATARFYNPDRGSDRTWDGGFLFRAVEGINYRAYVRSDGRWDFGIRYRVTSDGGSYRVRLMSEGQWESSFIDGGGDELFSESGSAVSLDLSDGGFNVVQLLVLGERASLWVNGRHCAVLDVSYMMVGADVEACVGLVSGWVTPGKVTRVEDFAVVSLDR